VSDPAGQPPAPDRAPIVLLDVGPARRHRVHPTTVAASATLLPVAAVLVGALVLWPVARTVQISITRGGGFGENVEAAWDLGAVLRTGAWAVGVPLLVSSLGLYLAQLSMRSRWLDRSPTAVLVAPVALPLVVVGVAVRLLAQPDPGRHGATWLADWVGRIVPGLGDSPVWLGPRLITYVAMAAFVWAWLGLAVVVFRAALRRLPPTLADVVRAHRGSPWRLWVDARWRPLLGRVWAVVFAIVAVMAIRTFDLLLVLAPGSVLRDASTLAVVQWQSPGGATTGPAAAVGVLWLLAVAVVGGVALVLLLSLRSGQPARRSSGGLAVAGAEPSRPRQDGPAGWRRPLVPAAIGLVWLAPLLVMIGTSFHSRTEAVATSWWSPPYSLESFGSTLGPGAAHDRSDLASAGSIALTAALALLVSAVVLVVALLAVRALAEMPGWRADPVVVALLVAAVVPIQAVAGPVADLLDRIDGYPGVAMSDQLRLVLIHVALGVPLAVVVLRSAGVEPGLDGLRAVWRSAETRKIRAAARWIGDVIWNREPALVAVLVLVFLQVWNDFVVGLMFGGPDVVPLGLRLYGQTRQFVTNSGVLAAASVVASLVPLAIVVATHHKVVDGLVGGGER
jgi:alpha-glucoside transport system permease protein